MTELQNALVTLAKCSWLDSHKQFTLLSEGEEGLMPDEQCSGYYSVLTVIDDSGKKYIGRVRCSDEGYTFVSVEESKDSNANFEIIGG